MNKKIKVSLAIIAKNEKASSEVIFPKIPKKSVDEIFVIDGNSTDGMQNYYKMKGIAVYPQKEKGYGAATLDARKKCKTDAFIIFHPDGNENPKDIAKIAALLKEGHKFVIPSRMIKGGYNEEDDRLIRPRKWFNQLMAFFVNFLWKEKHPFTTEIVQGFRGIRSDTFDLLKLDKKDCSIDFQMVIRALKYKVPIYEFPTREGNRLFGETNFKSIETGIIEVKMLWRELFDTSTFPKSN